MKHITPRIIMIEAVIGFAVCAGGYFMLVEPLDKKLVSTREQLSAVQTKLRDEQAATIAPDAAQKLVESATLFRQGIQQRSEPARSEPAMFSALMAAAEKSGVRIDQLQPVQTRSAPKADAPMPLPGDARRGYTITAIGSYGGVASFLRLLQTDLGLTALKSIRLSPEAIAGSARVNVTIDTEHFAFDLSSAAPTALDPAMGIRAPAQTR